MSQFGSIYAVAASAAIGGLLGLIALIALPETYKKQIAES
jgi:hypothetical protein